MDFMLEFKDAYHLAFPKRENEGTRDINIINKHILLDEKIEELLLKASKENIVLSDKEKGKFEEWLAQKAVTDADMDRAIKNLWTELKRRS